MESLEKRYGDNLLYHIRDGVLQKLKKSAEFRELSREADELSRKFQVIYCIVLIGNVIDV